MNVANGNTAAPIADATGAPIGMLDAATPRSEWAAGWRYPVLGLIGLSGCTLFAFTSGIFMEPMIAEFGWSRASFSGGFALQMVTALFTMPLVGWLVDRFGARPVVLFGGGAFALMFGLLGTTSGSLTQWFALCLVMSAFQATIAQPVWISGVVGHFEKSLGLAMAATLSGMGLGALVWPVLSAFIIPHLGWRYSFPALAATWALVVMPLVLLYFRPAPAAGARKSGQQLRGGYVSALRSFTFIGLVIAGGLFGCTYYGLIVHLVPILSARGLSLAEAAGIASLAGLFSIVGRFGTGYLLDRMSIRVVSIFVFLLPVIVAAILLVSGKSVPSAGLAVAILGLTAGAEMDILTYVASRAFKRELFASIYGFLSAGVAISSGLGPLLAGGLYDATGSYSAYLLLIIPTSIACAAIMAVLPLRFE